MGVKGLERSGEVSCGNTAATPSGPSRSVSGIAGILSRIPPRKDVIAYPLGHVWRRHRDHEAMVLRVKEEMEDAA